MTGCEPWPLVVEVHITGGLLDYAASRNAQYVDETLIDPEDDE